MISVFSLSFLAEKHVSPEIRNVPPVRLQNFVPGRSRQPELNKIVDSIEFTRFRMFYYLDRKDLVTLAFQGVFHRRLCMNLCCIEQWNRAVRLFDQ